MNRRQFSKLLGALAVAPIAAVVAKAVGAPTRAVAKELPENPWSKLKSVKMSAEKIALFDDLHEKLATNSIRFPKPSTLDRLWHDTFEEMNRHYDGAIFQSYSTTYRLGPLLKEFVT